MCPCRIFSPTLVLVNELLLKADFQQQGTKSFACSILCSTAMYVGEMGAVWVMMQLRYHHPTMPDKTTEDRQEYIDDNVAIFTRHVDLANGLRRWCSSTTLRLGWLGWLRWLRWLRWLDGRTTRTLNTLNNNPDNQTAG